jgi:hypothetical protein
MTMRKKSCNGKERNALAMKEYTCHCKLKSEAIVFKQFCVAAILAAFSSFSYLKLSLILFNFFEQLNKIIVQFIHSSTL